MKVKINMKEKGNNKFTLNVIVAYYKNTNPKNYREPIHSIFKNLAWLHGLDYAIDTSTKIFDKVKNYADSATDIIYIRSGQHTHVSLREFQKIIDGTFLKSIVSPFSRVDVFYQSQVFAKRFPFPLEFYRPMNYPYVEFHQGLKKEILRHKDA